ncbi:hypothetical protein [Luteococcus sp.]
MSMVLLESSLPTWIAGAVAMVMFLVALAFLLNVGGNRPHC